VTCLINVYYVEITTLLGDPQYIHDPCYVVSLVMSYILISTSDQARLRAEFKHINKRRKRNQMRFP
jgi:hypothetical protein